MFSGRPRLPPVTLPVSAVASRTTRMSRFVNDVIEDSVAGPKSYFIVRSPSENLSVNGSETWMNCLVPPRVTAGRGVGVGVSRMLYLLEVFPASLLDLLETKGRGGVEISPGGNP